MDTSASAVAHRPFSRKQTVSGLRWMLGTAGCWGAYLPIVQITGPIFTGYALWLGASESRIALLSAFVYLAGMAQLFSFFLTNRFRNKKAFVLAAGVCEIVLMLSVVAIPVVLPRAARLAALMLMVFVGTTASNLLLPTWQTWVSTLIPVDIRGRYLSKRTGILYLSTIVFGYLASRFIDGFAEGERYTGFVVVFGFGMVVGIAGYVAASRVAFPPMDKVMPVRLTHMLRAPFDDPAFGLFLLFYLLISMDDLARSDRGSRLLRRSRKELRRRNGLPSEMRTVVVQALGDVIRRFEEEEYDAMHQATLEAASRIREWRASPAADACWQALDRFSRLDLGEADRAHFLLQRAREVFAVVCLRQLLLQVN